MHLVTSKESSYPIFFSLKRPILYHTCATCSDLLSCTSSMFRISQLSRFYISQRLVDKQRVYQIFICWYLVISLPWLQNPYIYWRRGTLCTSQKINSWWIHPFSLIIEFVFMNEFVYLLWRNLLIIWINWYVYIFIYIFIYLFALPSYVRRFVFWIF